MWMHLGELSKAQSNFESVVALSGPDRSLAARCIVDPSTTALAYLALFRWMSGYPAQASKMAEKALQWATELEHVNTTAHARVFAGAQLAVLARDIPATRQYADSVIALVLQYDLRVWHPLVKVLQGWAFGEDNRARDGISLVKEAIAELDAMSTTVHRGHYLAILAELHAKCGDFASGLHTVREAHEYLEQTEHRLWHAELYRIEGEVRHKAGAPDVEVESSFAKAIEWARSQEAKSFELRATTSLARLWGNQRRYSDAHNVLRPLYEWFTEGFDTPDLTDAKALLDELREPGDAGYAA
jgi:predicted ATPase